MVVFRILALTLSRFREDETSGDVQSGVTAGTGGGRAKCQEDEYAQSPIAAEGRTEEREGSGSERGPSAWAKLTGSNTLLIPPSFHDLRKETISGEELIRWSRRKGAPGDTYGSRLT